MRHDLEGQVDVLSNSVAHQFKLAVGRDESNRPFFIEFRQFDALMELHIVNCNSFVRSSHTGFSGFLLHQQFIVHTCITKLVPNLHSGIPLSLEFNFMTPDTSALKMLPLFENNTLTFSITSM